MRQEVKSPEIAAKLVREVSHRKVLCQHCEPASQLAFLGMSKYIFNTP